MQELGLLSPSAKERDLSQVEIGIMNPASNLAPCIIQSSNTTSLKPDCGYRAAELTELPECLQSRTATWRERTPKAIISSHAAGHHHYSSAEKLITQMRSTAHKSNTTSAYSTAESSYQHSTHLHWHATGRGPPIPSPPCLSVPPSPTTYFPSNLAYWPYPAAPRTVRPAINPSKSPADLHTKKAHNPKTWRQRAST